MSGDDPLQPFERGTYYDREGREISLRKWADLVKDDRNFAYRRVAVDDIGLYKVSTVWLGINHDFSGHGPPVIFETMTFLADTPADTYMMRYHTEAEALAGHEAVCAEIRELDRQARAEHPITQETHEGTDK